MTLRVLREFPLRLHSRRGWLALLLAFVVLAIAIPLANASLAHDFPLHVPDHMVAVLGKFACYAMVAVAMDLIWGFTGILSLGHGVFFALGGYAMGMHLMLEIGGEGVYKSSIPDFMVFLDWKQLPWFWQGFDSFWFAVVMSVLVPGALAYVFGYFAFRSRIRGVYFSIITQALTFAMMLLFFRNDTGFGGNNGLTDFKRIYGWPLTDSGTKLGLYIISVLALLLVYLLCRYVVTSKAGRVLRAIRDAEGKVMFSGYNPLDYKLFAWTLSAIICGFAGALYVPQVGIINPSEMEPANSIEMAIWVALGGRGTLFGAATGAVIVNGAKSFLTGAFPEIWLYFLGALFVLVTLVLPEGIVGLSSRLSKRWRRAE